MLENATHLFAYGTLMFPAVWDRIVGRNFPAEPATAAGFAVYRVRNGLYPVMVRARVDQIVDGIVYHDLDQHALKSLDTYESDFYDRITLEATLADGETIRCQAYVLPEGRVSHASEERWDAAKFERHSLAAYLRQLD